MALSGIAASGAATARTSFISQPSPATGGNPSNPSSTNVTTTSSGMAPELESTLSLLSSHRSVLGYMLVSRGHPVSIIRHSGVIFEGDQGRRYASAVGKIVESVQGGLEEVAGDSDVDEVRFLRIRTRRHELMISPNDRYVLVVLHDPAT